ncbi:MAG: adenylosuccinate lyase [Planctomycetales bacterium]|nr:adenylosuccinate lyase [Planctomycetales bacterium]
MSHEFYQNPLIERYSSPEMSRLWGGQRKFETWRRLWIALAEAEQELGLPISDQQIEQMKRQVANIDFVVAAQYEKQLRHDVMAHVHTYGDVCPDAKPIIHLGATSCYVTDNADLLLLRDALRLIAEKLAGVIISLGKFAKEYRDLPCLAFTHLQPAQPTTVGKRATLWAYDLVLDLHEVEHRIDNLLARSVKGTTGTQASFLKLFDGDHAKVEQLEKRVAQKMGFDDSFAVTGQTYPRKIDAQILDVLSGIAQSSQKAATDIRILANRKELEEPFETSQIGSSAMPYKRNPMRSERICGLARFVTSLQTSPAQTLATQWMERTLDDSANRRLVLPQAFLAIDAILILYRNIAEGLVVYPQVVGKNLQSELPFMMTENILMLAVSQGGDRQELHERIRVLSHEAGRAIKEDGADNDLLDRIKADSMFRAVDFSALTDPRQFVGRAPEQVDAFWDSQVAPLCDRYSTWEKAQSELRV